MEMDTISLIISFVVIGYGLYGLFGAVNMIKSKYPPTMLIKEEVLMEARDLDGYCDAVGKPFFIFNIILILGGVLSILNSFFILNPTIDIISMVIMVGDIAWLAVFHNRAYRKFIR